MAIGSSTSMGSTNGSNGGFPGGSSDGPQLSLVDGCGIPAPAPAPEAPADSGSEAGEAQEPVIPAPWRKSWARKWRKGSTYRSLTHLQKLVCNYIEDNANDDGVCEVSYGRLSQALSNPSEAVSRSSIQDALSRLTQRGVIERIQTVHSTVHSTVHPPLRYRRVNFREYQSQVGEPERVTVQRTVHRYRSIRKTVDKSTVAPKRRGRPPDQEFANLLSALCDVYQQARGEPLDVPHPHRSDLKAIRKIIPDSEILARFSAFLADKYYPNKNLNRFRAAFHRYGGRPIPTKPLTAGYDPVPPIPGVES